MYALRHLLEQTRDGVGSAILISGEAGIGKSRLVREIIQQSDSSGESNCLVLQGHCYEQDRSLPFAPFVDLLRRSGVGLLEGVRLLDQLLKLAPDLAAKLPEVRLAPVAEPEQERRNLFAAWMSFLEGSERFERSDPCRIIILEDLHWCDDISLDLLLVIARRIAQQPSLLVLTYRSDEVAPALAHFLAQLERERLAHEIALDRLT